mmetsp:Transcript_3866/g.15014  ORF Transcript_3866/g.15014 Transcript_3866/m.15014 type:complete len:203 (-) Transcript_3866:1137-1745(-)
MAGVEGRRVRSNGCQQRRSERRGRRQEPVQSDHSAEPPPSAWLRERPRQDLPEHVHDEDEEPAHALPASPHLEGRAGDIHLLGHRLPHAKRRHLRPGWRASGIPEHQGIAATESGITLGDGASDVLCRLCGAQAAPCLGGHRSAECNKRRNARRAAQARRARGAAHCYRLLQLWQGGQPASKPPGHRRRVQEGVGHQRRRSG